MSDGINGSYQETFFIVPSYILDLPGLTLSYFRVYQAIFQFWNKGRDCWLCNSKIKEMSGITSSSTVSKALQFFEKNSLLIRKEIKGQRYLCQPPSKILLTDDDEGVSQEREGGSRKSDTRNKEKK